VAASSAYQRKAAGEEAKMALASLRSYAMRDAARIGIEK